jgi:hypothetical protein
MRFHIFCNVEGLLLEADGVTLTSEAKAMIGQRIKDFAHWYAFNDPTLLSHILYNGRNLRFAFANRDGDWAWFANVFITFVQNGLAAERAD